MTSIHPRNVTWTKTPPPKNGVGRNTGSECRLGFVYMGVTGEWHAVCYPSWDVGTHKTEAAARKAVELGYEHHLKVLNAPKGVVRGDVP